MHTKYNRDNGKFLVPSGVVEKKEIFNRAVWHNGDRLRANLVAAIHESRGAIDSAGLAISSVLKQG